MLARRSTPLLLLALALLGTLSVATPAAVAATKYNQPPWRRMYVMSIPHT